MKKVLLLIFLGLFLVSCGDSAEEKNTKRICDRFSKKINLDKNKCYKDKEYFKELRIEHNVILQTEEIENFNKNVENFNKIDVGVDKINYELVKFRLQEQQKNQNQESNEEKDNNKDQSNNQNQNKDSNQNNEDQDSKQNDQANSSNNNNERENKDKENNNNKQEKQKEDEKLSDNGKEGKPMPQDKQNATAILDAMKNNEKINKKMQISKSKRRKLEKDW